MRIAVTGATGMLGRDLLAVLANAHQVIGINREMLDLAYADALAPLLAQQPDCVIHTAAYTDVDGCERHPETAHRVNALGTEQVARACQLLNVPLVYISTDYIFDGAKQAPYVETDPPHPLNIYGNSKLAGERFVQAMLERFYIVRTAGLYSRHGRNFVNTILQKVQRGEALTIVHDQVSSPTYAQDVAQAIACLVEGMPFGVYHLSNAGRCSWYEFAKMIVTLTGHPQYEVKPIPYSALGRPALRPAYSALANHHWLATTGQALRGWQEALAEVLSACPR